MNDASPDRQDKFRRYRARKKAQGLRELRMWVPDVNAPGFQEQLDDQLARINVSEDEREVMIFLEATAEEVWRDLA
jgi:antidote-toxin recognition MazE-like antitoxin